MYACSGWGITGTGPGGVMVSLGLEQVVSNPVLVTQFYNYWALLTLLVIAVSAGQRDSKFVTVLLPLWAAFEMYVGWLKYPDSATGFGIIVVCAALSIMMYMVETRHERFGIAGPGNMVVKIFTFLILLQCVVVFFNTSAIFPSDTPQLSASNNQYAAIDLGSQMGKISDSGGILETAVDTVSATVQLAISALILILKCLLSIALFSVVLSQVFPWIVQAGPIGAAFLILMQFAIWLMYVLFIYQVFYRPGPDAGY
jgi:hypothetical protein